MIEGFQFAGIDRNLDKVRWMADYPFEVPSWPRADCRNLMGLFNAGWPWTSVSVKPVATAPARSANQSAL